MQSMSRKLAVKRLTQSDLTLFEWQHKNRNGGNQKSINLNANVFIDDLFPLLPQISSKNGGRFPIDLYIYGPSTRTLHNLQRKIIKTGSYKNWRLNGEFIYNPSDQNDRYNNLNPGDLVIIEFFGIDSPTSAKVIFLARADITDRSILDYFDGILGTKPMAVLTPQQIEDGIKGSTLGENHPLLEMQVDQELDLAIYSGDISPIELKKNPYLGRITKEDFLKAKEKAEFNGLKGEEFINDYLEKQKANLKITEFVWQSNINPVWPYDFSVDDKILIDVKTTDGDFSRDIYISNNELIQMSQAERYDLYRVYKIDNTTAKLRICEDLKPFADSIAAAFSNLPAGVKSNGISLSPALLSFTEEIDLEFTSDEV
jgi:hypothetical protein